MELDLRHLARVVGAQRDGAGTVLRVLDPAPELLGLLGHVVLARCAALKGLDELDQRVLVVVAEVAAEVVTLIDDEVRAFADRHQVRHQIAQSGSCLLIGGLGGNLVKPFQSFLELGQQRDQLLHMLLLVFLPFGQDPDVGNEIDGRALGDRPNLQIGLRC